jgi:hypothetical protein
MSRARLRLVTASAVFSSEDAAKPIARLAQILKRQTFLGSAFAARPRDSAGTKVCKFLADRRTRMADGISHSITFVGQSCLWHAGSAE